MAKISINIHIHRNLDWITNARGFLFYSLIYFPINQFYVNMSVPITYVSHRLLCALCVFCLHVCRRR